ncbi:MAG: RsmD family RNA methyltransferase, partial [Flavobacteriia bacterium]|nr:RsmD family RNA methyltransferase [Flavobacteriia bacterium]
MNQFLLTDEVQDWLFENIGRDSREVSLKKSIFKNISSSELAGQLKGLQIAKHKFGFLYDNKQIYYPPTINLEQSSSQTTAEYKSNLVSGKLLIDLTAGMGTDAYFFSKNFDKVIAIERNPELAEISEYNYNRLGCSNLEFVNSDFKKFLNENPNLKPDLIYLDPSRRNSSGRKFLIEELEPDLNIWMDRLIQISGKVMVKLSPLSDLSSLIEKFHQITEIHPVAVKNEMKELLL